MRQARFDVASTAPSNLMHYQLSSIFSTCSARIEGYVEDLLARYNRR